MQWITRFRIRNAHHEIETVNLPLLITMKTNFAVELLNEVISLRSREQLHFLSHTFNRQPACFIAYRDLQIRTTIVAILAHELVVTSRINRDHFSQTLLEH